MIRDAVKGLLARAGRTTAGQNAVHAALRDDFGPTRFSDARLPESARCFEDLDFLFTSSRLNHGIASLRLDEAAHLFRTVRSLGAVPATIVEIGRFRGGSTVVIATAMSDGSELWSYDLHLTGPDVDSAELDRELADALDRLGIADGVRLIVGDSRTAEPPPRPADLVFVDGDHSYEGARADFERWRELLRPGGHVLFHDAVPAGTFGLVHEGVVRLADELERLDPRFRRLGDAGTVAHFQRSEA